MAEQKSTFDIRNEVNELNGAELEQLQKLLSDPVVVKYLRNRVLYLSLDVVLGDVEKDETDSAFRTRMLHNQAYIKAYNDILSDIPKVVTTTKE